MAPPASLLSTYLMVRRRRGEWPIRDTGWNSRPINRILNAAGCASRFRRSATLWGGAPLMILHILRALFILLMGAVAWNFLGDLGWLTMAFTLALALLFVGVD